MRNVLLIPAEGCACMESISLWVKTSNKDKAQTDEKHELEVKLTNGEIRAFKLSKIPKKRKSKLYTFNLDDPASKIKCLSIFDIEGIAINAIGTNGWNINSAVTFLGDTAGRTFTGSIDRNVNAWVDHKDKDRPERERLELSLTEHN